MNEIKVYRCEKCGEIMDETAYRTSGNGIHFNPPTADEPCGGTMRAIILADPAEVRRETIEECAKVCEQIGKDIVCPEECAFAIRALADAPREVEDE